jgi:hypothetical protein
MVIIGYFFILQTGRISVYSFRFARAKSRRSPKRRKRAAILGMVLPVKYKNAIE